MQGAKGTHQLPPRAEAEGTNRRRGLGVNCMRWLECANRELEELEILALKIVPWAQR